MHQQTCQNVSDAGCFYDYTF